MNNRDCRKKVLKGWLFYIGLNLSLFLPVKLHAECATTTCPVDPLSPQLEAQLLELRKQSEDQVENLLQRSPDLLSLEAQIDVQAQPIPDASTSKQDFPDVKKGQLYIFVSLSMPEDALIELGKQAKQVDGILVLRGLKNGSFKETTYALKNVVENSEYGLIIDPSLFKAYDVNTVPTFVVAEAHSPKHNPSSSTPAHDKLVGHVTLAYALEELVRHGELSFAQTFLTQLKQRRS